MGGSVYKLADRSELKKGDIFVLDVGDMLVKCIVTLDWVDEYGQHCYTSVRYEGDET